MREVTIKIVVLGMFALNSFALPLKNGEHFKQKILGEAIVKNKSQKFFHKIIKPLGNDLYVIKVDSKNELLDHYEKVYPNYIYYGNYLDRVTIPNDTYFTKQYHHKQIKTIEAWEITQGEKDIIVAVTDNEFQIDHKDLIQSWWKNEHEIPNNGIDDDQNGYIDDIYGWDFFDHDNDVDSTDEPTHGTHVSGIIAATSGNNFGGTGIAPKVKVMPLRWYGSEGEWTTAIIVETYNYAINNGAKIISTSYNIDSLVDDELYRDLLLDVRKRGVLIFNSAGNGNKKNPARQNIDELILVCSVTSSSKSQDIKSRFSNYGTGIDICAPGDPIFSTVQVKYGMQDQYGELSGTSMSTPAAAAVAALIWSSHPNFSDEEVIQKLYSSADKIDDENFLYKGLLGAGRINALKAVE